MSELTQEQYEQLPDFVKGDYEEQDGKFVSVGELKAAKLKQSLNEVDSKYKTQLNEVNEKLSTFEQQQKTAIEKARQEALEEARNKGDVAAIEKRYQEQMADLEKRTAERVRGEVDKEYSLKFAKQNAEKELLSIVSALKPVDEDAADLLKIDLGRKQQVTEDGKIIYLNDDGSASTLDSKGFIEQAKKQARYKRLIQADHFVNGGEKMNGSNGGSAPTNKKFDEMNGAELKALRETNPTLYQQLKDEYYQGAK